MYVFCIADNAEVPCATRKLNNIEGSHADSEHLPVLTAGDIEQHVCQLVKSQQLQLCVIVWCWKGLR